MNDNLRTVNIEKIISNIYVELIKKRPIDLSLMEGSPGIVLFLYYYSELYNSSEAKDKYEYLLDKIINKINKNGEELLPTYCDGLIGLLTLLNFIGSVNPDYDNIFDSSIEDYVSDIMVTDLNNREYDFLHGALGCFNYYLLKYNCSKDENDKRRIAHILNEGIIHLDSIAHKSGEGYCWDYPIYDEPTMKGKFCVNLGLAHGTPSILSILTDFVYLGLGNELTEKMVIQTSQFIIDKGNNPPTFHSKFPFYYSPSVSLYDNTPLAWCYGDLGVAIALLKAGMSISDSDITQSAINIALQTTKRRNIRSTSVYDAGFCHGTSGSVHLYNKLFKQTRIQEFAISRDYWVGKTIEYSNFRNNSLAGFHSHAGNGVWEKSYGLLKGIGGIGLVMMSLLDDKDDWGKLLLLNNL